MAAAATNPRAAKRRASRRGLPPAVSTLRRRRPKAGQDGAVSGDARRAGPAGRGRSRRSAARRRWRRRRRQRLAGLTDHGASAPPSPAGCRAGRLRGAPGRGTPAHSRSLPSLLLSLPRSTSPPRPPPPWLPRPPPAAAPAPSAGAEPGRLRGAASLFPPPRRDPLRGFGPPPRRVPPRSSFRLPGPRLPSWGRREAGRGVGLRRAVGAQGEPKMAGGSGCGGRRGGLC